MSSDSWKHVRVYVASGYYDMEGERQHLNDIVLPQLRQQCILYRTQVLHGNILLCVEMFLRVIIRNRVRIRLKSRHLIYDRIRALAHKMNALASYGA